MVIKNGILMTCDREKPSSISKLKKKVRFNLNVKAYEAISHEVASYLSEEEKEEEEEEGANNTAGSLHYEEDVQYEDEDVALDESDHELDDDDVSSIYDDDDDDNVAKNIQFQTTESRSNPQRYDSSVLTPIENLSQWREIKAKAKTADLKMQKENSIISTMDSHHSDSKLRVSNVISVDASLSNWLSSLEKNPLINSGP
ncbi:pheromone-processing carboxypeptidase KEX1-like [Salvia miltiorrhiza]|uniref:pheromone-processing carboxypeptidase KEX1-like n=1 Tax=Salvia miltiorrhiza TaxID=226208 RepID=UPI0025ABBA50|nr:pheromone-processing carboxypeptidase KEX1-like [Salvia miltiorrhiza]